MPRTILATLSLAFAVSALAQDVAYSPPVGGMTVNITAGTTIAPITTSFTMPLYDAPAASGATAGVIATVGSNTVGVASAGWTSGGLVMSGFPYAIRILSGSASGLTVSISGNTTDSLTISGADLLQLGVAPGDRFELIPVDTLNSLFGSTTLQGGATPDDADIVSLGVNFRTPYYFNSTLNRWVRTTGPTTDRGSTPIPLDSVISVTRKSSQLSLAIVGRVPTSRAMFAVANSGHTFTHTGFPTDVSLGNLSLQSRLPGWVSGSDPSTSDALGVNNGGFWTYYFHNGSFWQRTTGPATNRDTVTISAGTAIRLVKQGVASGTSYFTRNAPY